MAAGGGRPFPKQKAGNGDGQGDARHLDEKSEFRGKIEKKSNSGPLFFGPSTERAWRVAEYY